MTVPTDVASTDVIGRTTALGRDVLYATVGAGLMAFQRIQFTRRELERTLAGDDPCQSLRGRVDELLDSVESTLPEPAGELLNRSRATAETLTRTMALALGLTLPRDHPGPSEG